MAGVRMEVRVREGNQGNRVHNLKVLNTSGDWVDVSPTSSYTVAMPSFLAKGGSKHWKKIGDLQIKHIPGYRTDNQVLRSYIEKNSPLTQEDLSTGRRLGTSRSNTFLD